MKGVYEHRPKILPTYRPDAKEAVLADSYEHPMLLIVSSWCDLVRDYAVRSGQSDKKSNLLDYVLTCGVYDKADIKENFDNPRLWEIAKSNKDTRYHKIKAAATAGGEEFPELFLDFKRFLAVPLAGLYDAIEAKKVKRVARIPPLYREEIMQRFYNFHSRVSLPD